MLINVQLRLAFFILLFLKNKERLSTTKCAFPYKKPFVLLFISWCISSVVAYIGFWGALPQLIGNVSKDLILMQDPDFNLDDMEGGVN